MILYSTIFYTVGSSSSTSSVLSASLYGSSDNIDSLLPPDLQLLLKRYLSTSTGSSSNSSNNDNGKYYICI